MEMRSATLSSGPEDERALEQARLRNLLCGPLPAYAEKVLKISPKEGMKIEPLRFNKAQLYIDAKLNEQMEEKKRIRALILKGRQQGVSTYVASRFFRRQHAVTDTNIYILSHELESADTLFNIPKKFYNALPIELRPQRGQAGAKKMTFPYMRCSYSVGTAGKKETGRSKTIQLFHGSEVAFWDNAQGHLAGVLRTIGPVGTEIILESTANGIGNAFHEMWLKAERGEGDYIAIFVPWFWQEEYRLPAPKGWQPEDEEKLYAETHELDLDQSYWLHQTNIEMGGTPGKIHWRFHQEYPGTSADAFQASGAPGLIKAISVTRARQNRTIVATDLDAKYLGIDCARNVQVEGDATHFIDRWGRTAGTQVNLEMRTDDTMEIVGKTIALDNEHHFDMICIDIGGPGAAVYDRLREQGRGARLCLVDFGAAPNDVIKYKNKRAEMYFECNEWFEDVGGARVADDPTLHQQLCVTGYREDSHGRKVMTDKDKIRKLHGFSPDRADALITTFARKVIKPQAHVIVSRAGWRNRSGQQRSWMSR